MSLCNPYNTDCTLKASKNPLVKKAVLLKISNIDDAYNVDEVKDYVATLNVRLINCFELPFKRKQPSENKSFRLCIYARDKNNLLVKKNCSSGIVIQDWVFHPQKVGDTESASALVSNPQLSSPIIACGHWRL